MRTCAAFHCAYIDVVVLLTTIYSGYGTYHHLSVQHLRRYLAEFSGRHNVRDADTAEQMRRRARGLGGQRLRREMLAGREGSAAAA